ncbi:MAG: methionyl-tRNA formyltransferase [Firmicutes bacterium]|nr:methionyl-tRNA formyltransferase [Bacillota bacterium]
MGTPDFAVPSLIAVLRDAHEILAVVTRPDRPRGRGLELSPSPVKQSAVKHRFPVVQPSTCRSPQFVEWLRDVKPDVIVVVAFGQILPREVLEIPSLGCINVHASLLPKYRGAAPINWALIRGERVTGVTTMYMSERLDAGDVILQKEVAVSPDDNAGTLHDKLKHEGADLLTVTLRLLGAGKAPRAPQDESQATFAPSLTSKDEVIDWNRPAGDIRNHVRGMSPWPGAHTVKDGRKIKVLAATVLDSAGTEIHHLLRRQPEGAGRAGLVLAADETNGLVVQAGEGLVRLDEVQPEGGRRMPAADYLRGARLAPGDVLGR